MTCTPTQNGACPSSSPSTSSNATLNILDEFANREQRCKNLIVYNLKEPSDRQTDKLRFQELHMFSGSVFILVRNDIPSSLIRVSESIE